MDDILSQCVSSKQIRDMALKNGWDEQQLTDWARRELNPDISDVALHEMIEQVFHYQPWWDFCR